MAEWEEAEEHPFKLGPRTVKIGAKTYPAVAPNARFAGTFRRAWIPMENGNLVHVDYADRKTRVMHNLAAPFSVAEHHTGDYDEFNTVDEVNARIHELATQKMDPNDIKINQKGLRELRFHPGSYE